MSTTTVNPLRLDVDACRPLVGLHRDWTDEQYFALPALSSSRVKKAKTPAHLYAELTEPEDEDTESLRLGTALHLALFQPSEYRGRVVVAPDVDRRTKAGKEDWARFIAESGDKLVLASDAKDTVEYMLRSLNGPRHVRASRIIATSGPCEAVAVWVDEETGLPCKAKLDKFIPGVLALDAKTTSQGADEFSFGRTVAAYGYHRQQAWYADGFQAVTGTDTPFVFVVFETERPYGISLYTLPPEAVYAGRSQNRAVLRTVRKCIDAGEWPDYPDEVRQIAVPGWATSIDAGGLPVDEEHPF